MAIKWDTEKEDRDIIVAIAHRANKLLGSNIMNTMMDVTAVHLNDVPLRLEALLQADDFNFAHDINGIAGHLNRQTAKLTKGFLPRFSKPDVPKIEPELKAEIDNLTHYDMCYMWRKGTGNPLYFDNTNPASEYFKKRLFDHYGGFTAEISKQIGW